MKLFLDLSTVVSYELKEISKWNKNKWQLKMYDFQNKKKHLFFNDTEFVLQIIRRLVENHAKNESNGKHETIKREIKAISDILYASHLFFFPSTNSCPFFFVFKNKQISIYSNYNQSLNSKPIKILDILEEFEDVHPFMFNKSKYGLKLIRKTKALPSSIISNCTKNHGLTAEDLVINDKCNQSYIKCNECLKGNHSWPSSTYYSCFVCSYYVCSHCVLFSNSSNIYLLSNSKNERNEWLLHLQFLFTYKIMPNEISNLSKLNYTEKQSVLEEHFPRKKNYLLEIMEIMEITEADINKLLMNGEKNIDKLYFIDKLFGKWREENKKRNQVLFFLSSILYVSNILCERMKILSRFILCWNCLIFHILL